MAVQNNRSYPMYVLNLDNSRLFWISLIFILIFGLCFAIGLYFGRHLLAGSSSYGNQISSPSTESGVHFDTFMLNRISTETQNREFEFYQVLPKDKLTKEDIAHSIPKSTPPKSQAVDDDDFERKAVVVEHEGDDSHVKTTIESRTKTVIVKKTQPVRKTSVKIISSYDDSRLTSARPYTVQVASYQHQNVAGAIQNRLVTKKYSAYIVRAKVNGKLYFRVRVGPFSSKEKARQALNQLRNGMGFTAAYICSR